MPVELIWEGGGVLFKCTGTLSAKEVIKGNEDMYGDPRWPKAHFQIADLRSVARAEFVDEEIERAANLEKVGSSLNPDARLIVIKPRNADASVTKLVTAWFMSVHDKVTFSVRIVETLEEAESLI